MQPTAQALSLPVDFSHGYPKALGGNEAAAAAIKQSAQTHAVVLASWEHYNIQFLAADLGVPKADIPNWPHDDFDTVYVITLDAKSVRGYTSPSAILYGVWLRPRCADSSRLSTLSRVTPRTQGTFLHLAVEAQGYTPKSTTCDPAKYVPPPGEPGEEYAAREKIVEE